MPRKSYALGLQSRVARAMGDDWTGVPGVCEHETILLASGNGILTRGYSGSSHGYGLILETLVPPFGPLQNWDRHGNKKKWSITVYEGGPDTQFDELAANIALAMIAMDFGNVNTRFVTNPNDEKNFYEVEAAIRLICAVWSYEDVVKRECARVRILEK